MQQALYLSQNQSGAYKESGMKGAQAQNGPYLLRCHGDSTVTTVIRQSRLNS